MHQASLSSGSLIRVSQQHSISSENFDQDMISSLETSLNTLNYILGPIHDVQLAQEFEFIEDQEIQIHLIHNQCTTKSNL